MLRTTFSLVVVGLSILFGRGITAGPLTSAEVTKIINKVSVIDPASGGHPAIIREVIKDDLGLETGIRSRSELLFQDDTLTRIGPETFFSFKSGTRDMTLEKGSMLLQVPKGLGGAKIHTAAVTAAITGTTIMMEYVPKQYIKVLVLEGSLRLSRNGLFGDSLVLKPGKMVIMRPDAKKIPEPIDVDLAHIVKTSTLVNFPDSAPLPSTALIQDEIDHQQTRLATKNLAPTNLVMGHGTNVILTANNPLGPSFAPSGIFGGPLNRAVIPILGNLTSTVGNTTSSLDNLITSSTSTVGGIATNLLGGSSIITAIPISSSTQVLSLLNNATVGIISVAPTVNTIVSVPTSALGLTSAVNGAATLPDTASGVVSSSSSAATTAAPPVVTTVTAAASLPTTLANAPLTTQNLKASALPLALGR